ncbi:MAG: nucleotidyltransferase family protein [Ahrensia sp.]|nr:nucleotidyltransferase family protein [Ahrensia sp.]
MICEERNDCANRIDQAMVLAAGLGTRMRPITDTMPKPLVTVAGRSLLDHALDALERSGVSHAAVNVHYLADQIEAHLEGRAAPRISISDEREALLDSGGGVKRALAHLKQGPLYILNSDSFWIDGATGNLDAMADRWAEGDMDMLLLLARKADAVGFDGAGDFFMDEHGKLARRGSADHAPYVYAGAIVCKTQPFEAIKEERFSLNRLFDDAIARGRLYGHLLDGLWLHVGTPGAISEAEATISRFLAGRQT